MIIHVGNLARDVTEQELKEQFTPFGKVESVSIIKDKFSGLTKGFAYIDMPEKNEAQAALDGLKGKMLKERTMDISESRPQTGKRRPYSGRTGAGKRRF